MSQFINVGIDLGTTTTEAVIFDINNKQEPYRIVKSGTNMDYIPSAVHIAKNGKITVGQKAYENSKIDDKSIKFKRLAGTDYTKTFESSGKKMSVEQLQAEVLKEIKPLIESILTHPIRSAVITVPAQFTSNQKKSVETSAKMAGLEYVELLQEPVAAAMAFSNTTKGSIGNWLIYDFGGGTFDVAIVKITNEEMITTATQGHPQLGGSDIDVNIVNEFIIPELKKSDFEVDSLIFDNNFKSALCIKAEDAKKDLTLKERTTIEISGLEDEEGEEIELSIEFNRQMLDKCIKPLIDQSFEYCEKALSEAKITKSDLSQVCLVGGPTQTPSVRKMVEDYFGIKPNTSVDATTAVAKGACIFAQSKAIPDQFLEIKKDNDQLHLHLDYLPMTVNEEQIVIGKFDINKAEFVEIKLGTSWSSGKIPVKDKKFIVDIVHEEGDGENDNKSERFEYSVNVFGKNGMVLETNCSSFVVVRGLVIEDFIVAQTIGIEKNDGSFEPIIEKGERYPITKTTTMKYVSNNYSDEAYIVKVVEMDEVAVMAKFIQATVGVTQQTNIVKKSDLKVELQNGDEIKIIFELNKSGVLTVKSYIKKCDQYFNFGNISRAIDVKIEEKLITSLEFLEVQVREMKKDSTFLPFAPELKRISNRIEILKEQYRIQGDTLDEDQKSKFDHEVREVNKEVEKIKVQTIGTNHKEIDEKIQHFYELASSIKSMGGDTETLCKEIEILKSSNNDFDEQSDKVRQAISKSVNSSIEVQQKIFSWNIATLKEEGFTDMKYATILIQSGYGIMQRGDAQELSIINRQLSDLRIDDEAQSDLAKWSTGLMK